MISIIASAIVAVIALQNLRTALYVMVFLLPFLPRSMGIGFGSDGGAITFTRVTIPVLLVISFLKALYSRKFLIRRRGTAPNAAIVILAALCITKITSSIYNDASIVHAVDDMARSFGTFLLFFMFNVSVDMYKISIFVWFSLLISSAFAALEYYLGYPIHALIVSQSIIDTTLMGQVRDGAYRVQALFDGPLFFSEFIVVSFAAFLFLWPQLSALKRLVSVAIYALLILANGSRSVLIVLPAMVLLHLLLPVWRHSKSSSRNLLVLLLLIAVIPMTYLSISYIIELGQNDPSGTYQYMDPYTRSSVARAFQFFQVYNVVINHPFIGVGMEQNFVSSGIVDTLDNSFLRILLESGFLGLILFILFFVVIFIYLITLLHNNQRESENRTTRFLIVLLFGFLAFRFFFQDPAGNVLLFALLGAGLSNIGTKKQL